MENITKTYGAETELTVTCWGNDKGTITGKKYTEYTSLDALKKDIQADFESGAIEDSFGVMSVDSALIDVIEDSVVLIDDKNYYNTSYTDSYAL